jgi:hypothetical protein
MYIEKYSEFFENALGSQTTGREYHYKNNSFFFSKLPLTVFDQKIQNTFSKISCFKSK